MKTLYFKIAKKLAPREKDGTLDVVEGKTASSTDSECSSEPENHLDYHTKELSEEAEKSASKFFNGKCHDIRLTVGERKFEVPACILRKATWFRKTLVPRDVELGIRYSDTDGDIFAHIVRYLRHNVVPDIVTFGNPDGADFQTLYDEVYGFGVDGLIEVMKEKMATRGGVTSNSHAADEHYNANLPNDDHPNEDLPSGYMELVQLTKGFREVIGHSIVLEEPSPQQSPP